MGPVFMANDKKKPARWQVFGCFDGDLEGDVVVHVVKTAGLALSLIHI